MRVKVLLNYLNELEKEIKLEASVRDSATLHK